MENVSFGVVWDRICEHRLLVGNHKYGAVWSALRSVRSHGFEDTAFLWPRLSPRSLLAKDSFSAYLPHV